MNVCDFDIYINPTRRHPTEEYYVVAAWAGPCWHNCRPGAKLYSDNQCFFASIGLLVRAVLSTEVTIAMAVSGEYEIGYIF
ncbi:Protein of unknown function [Pyronema omphalodes CBS 100304]|uniref:Uncharacterized protein n=1 Tax=Pyronema omphalodes (strain CBS 100304) TaxID=1076935 RepID=U4KYL3_PYROM|nr:Protein of unknown function [Pyronema omphalodes CBS 100304]